ncbi:fasciclin domain-containing protein [Flavivirga jejuensis]|uniref:Fasciclin domain-containing protein n=1 Tax=Flavivirga jejuensis TaxID=870487 RepID=A0ABT8WKH9_9FLAO|nr:fasciclin domain-containing protein [Flavivirga jejuensis]MDO5973667.1 fasciclin domain-containing protein [Flavivirga jejuensis]
MKKRYELITSIAFVIITTFGCKPDPLEYARPENLVGTIYKQLESMGTFNYYLKSLDQTEFKEPLTKGGAWTIFAPTDEAFELFMKDEGFSSFDEIPPERILHLVQYSIIIDSWNTTTLTYFPNQFYKGPSFRRRTQYKDPIVTLNDEDYPSLGEYVRSGVYSELEAGGYLVDTSNDSFKTTDYWLQCYMDYNPLELSDYAYLFPGETYNSGDMKVFEAHVSQTNIVSENGLIYALDKVIEPRPNLYQNLSAEAYNGKYSIFKSLLKRFGYLRERGEELNTVTNETQTIYELAFQVGIENNNLPFDPNTEEYPKLINNVDRTWANATGLLVPTNDALEDYLNGDSVLGKFYDSYDDMPLDVLGKFLSPNFIAQYYNICPSYFGQTFDIGVKLVNYEESDVVDKKFCTNGFFVGVNKVYTNKSFSTIMGTLLLDPDYTIMLNAVQGLGIDTALESTGVKFSMFGIKNNEFVDIADPNNPTRKITISLNAEHPEDISLLTMTVTGDPDPANNRDYPENPTNPSASDLAYVATTIEDIVLNQIVEEEIDPLANNYYPTKSGEFVYITANTVAGGGDIYNGESSAILSVSESENGRFYEMSDPIERPLSFTYRALVDNSPTFDKFLEVLEAADAILDIANVSNDKLISFLNLDKTFTLFAPNNTAVQQAINDGVILDPANLGSLSTLELAIAKSDLLNFVKKHFLQQAITTDGKTTGTYPSLYFGQIIDFAPVYDEFTVENNHGTSSLTLINAKTAEVAQTGNLTNLLSKRVVIHEIDNYIK